MNEKTVQIIVISIATIVTGAFIVFLIRKENKHIESGELMGTDPISVFETWDSKSNDTISKLHPKIRQRTTEFVNDLSKQGIKFRLYSGFRSFEEQAELYGKGRTQQELITAGVDAKYSQPSEKRVTNAKPGTSFHNYGLAFDGVEIVNGNAIWETTKQQQIVDTAKKYGFYWGGNFVSFKDKPHYEDQQFGNINQLLALYNSGKLSNGYLIV